MGWVTNDPTVEERSQRICGNIEEAKRLRLVPSQTQSII